MNIQKSFSTLWDGYATNKDAMKARNAEAKILRAKYSVRCFTIPNQIKPYDGLGQINGGTCNVYFLEYND